MASICARFVGHGGGMAVGFHEQQRLAIERQADLRVILHAADRHAVEKLQRAGDDLRRDDGGDGVWRRPPCDRKVASMVAVAAGLGISFSSTLVMMPSVPSLSR